jgi:hypothetical protein
MEGPAAATSSAASSFCPRSNRLCPVRARKRMKRDSLPGQCGPAAPLRTVAWSGGARRD